MANKPAKFDIDGVFEVIDAAKARAADNERRSLARPVVSWSQSSKPGFKVKKGKNLGFGVYNYQIEIKNGDIFGWVDQGTKLHEITPNGDYPLRIRGGGAYSEGERSYEPITEPGRATPARPSGKYFPEDSPAKSVFQKIEARGFTDSILEKAEERLERALKTEIDKYLERNLG